VKFAEQVLNIIEGDLKIFEGMRPDIASPEVYENVSLTNQAWGSTVTVGTSETTALPFIAFEP
jgi:hypothetical protein